MSKLSSTAIQRLAHQVWPKVPRFDWDLMPPLAARGRERGKNSRYHMALISNRFLPQGEQVFQLRVGKLGQPPLAGADHAGGHVALALDLLLQCTGAEKLMHLDVARLSDAKGAIGRLVLDGRVPPAVEVEDVLRGRQ